MKKTILSLAFAGAALTYNAQTWNTTLNAGSGLKLGTSGAVDLPFYTNSHEGMVLSRTGDLKLNNSLKVMGSININDNFNISYTAPTSTTPRLLSFMPIAATSTVMPQPYFKPLCNLFTGNAAVTFPDLIQVSDANQSAFLSMGVSGGDGIIAVEPFPGGVFLANKLRLNPGCTNDVYICEGGGFTKIFNSAGVVGDLDVSKTVRIGGGTFGLQSSLDINTPPALAKAINITNTSLGNIFNVSSTGTAFFSGKVGIGAATTGANLLVQDPTAAEARIYSVVGDSKLIVANQTGGYGFSIDNNAIGHIGSGTDILNFRNNALQPQVWIGSKPTTGSHLNFTFAVGGKLLAHSIYVTLQGNWADYVFEDNYNLPKLSDVESYYKSNKHLPEIPSAKEVKEKGIDVEAMNILLLKKVEELTLYAVEQQKISKQQQEEIDSLKKSIIK